LIPIYVLGNPKRTWGLRPNWSIGQPDIRQAGFESRFHRETCERVLILKLQQVTSLNDLVLSYLTDRDIRSVNESGKILKNMVPQIICYILKNMPYWENVDENL